MPINHYATLFIFYFYFLFFFSYLNEFYFIFNFFFIKKLVAYNSVVGVAFIVLFFPDIERHKFQSCVFFRVLCCMPKRHMKCSYIHTHTLLCIVDWLTGWLTFVCFKLIFLLFLLLVFIYLMTLKWTSRANHSSYSSKSIQFDLHLKYVFFRSFICCFCVIYFNFSVDFFLIFYFFCLRFKIHLFVYICLVVGKVK